MNIESIQQQLNNYKENQQTLDAANFLIKEFGLENPNLEGFFYRPDDNPNLVVVTTEGNFGGLQKIMIPKNLFNLDLNLVMNLLAHEMLHVKQKTLDAPILDKNEREWQAYFEMLFHQNFPQIPDAPDFNRKQFAEKALEYYRRMGEGSELQLKYADQKKQVEQLLEKLNAKADNKKPIAENNTEDLPKENTNTLD